MDLYTLINSNLKSKKSSSGWETFNCPMCVSRGESRPDTRSRGGIRRDGMDLGIHCFNCGFKTRWKYGTPLSKNMRLFMKQIDISEDQIRQINFDLWRNAQKYQQQTENHNPEHILEEFPSYSSPDDLKPLEWFATNDPNNEQFLEVLQYLADRDPKLIDLWDFHISTKRTRPYSKALVIPCYYDRKLVGLSWRKLSGKVRYNKNVPANYMFNLDCLKKDRKYVVITDGIIDAIYLDGISLMGSYMNEAQAKYLNSFDVTKIVVPDRDAAGSKLINLALENNWRVSIPPNTGAKAVWEDDIKDVSAACERYGRIYTLKTIIESSTTNTLKIKTAEEFYIK